jgi:phasin
MAQDTYTIPPEMREFAEKSVEQAKKAFDGFFEAANKAGDDAQSKANDATGKVMEYAKANVEAGLDYAKRLSMARSPEEIWAIQNEFIRSQSAAFMAQSKEAAKNFKV